MSNKRRAFIAATIIVIIVVGIFLLVKSNDVEDDYEQVEFLIGMSHSNLIEEWQISLHDEMDAYSNRYDNIKIIYTNAGNSTFKQLNDVDKLLEFGIDLLIITPNDVNLSGSVMEEINKKIPVILLDEDVEANDYTMAISPDYYNIGVMGANRIVELSQGEAYYVLSVNGPIDDSVVTTINSGFLDTLDENRNVNIVGNVYSNWLDGDTKTGIMETLKSTDQVDAVFVQSNELVLEAIEALKEIELDIPVISVSKHISDRYLTYMDLGDIDTVIYTPTGGEEAIVYAIAILKNSEGDNVNQMVPKRIIIKSNVITAETKASYRYFEEKEKQGRVGYIETSTICKMDIQSLLGVKHDVLVCKVDDDVSSDEKIRFQKQCFESLLDSNVDIIIMKPESSEGWQKLIEQAKEKNVLVICVANTPYIDGELLDSNVLYVGPDYLDQGRKLAHYLIQEVYSTNYDIGILEITNNSTLQLTREKTNSLNKYIGGYSRINIIDSIEIDGSNSEEVNEQYIKLRGSLSKYETRINVVYLHDGSKAAKIQEILDEYQLDEVVIISSNDDGEIQHDGIIDYQVLPSIIYDEQLTLIVDDYSKDGQLKLEKIFLPNIEFN